MRSLSNKSSTRYGGISYQLLKEAGPGIITPIIFLFNRSLPLSVVPDEWKTAIVY